MNICGGSLGDGTSRAPFVFSLNDICWIDTTRGGAKSYAMRLVLFPSQALPHRVRRDQNNSNAQNPAVPPIFLLVHEPFKHRRTIDISYTSCVHVGWSWILGPKHPTFMFREDIYFLLPWTPLKRLKSCRVIFFFLICFVFACIARTNYL